jgi:hypothetical protein
VFWASAEPETAKTERHLVLVGSAPVACLCGHTFPVRQLGKPCGLPCWECIRQFDNLSVVTLRQRDLADMFGQDDLGLLNGT